MSTSIQLHSGNYFDYVDPIFGNLKIGDVARALSHICRFAGHVSDFYSVAQHSVNVSHIVPQHLAFEGLMHDAAEALFGDLPTPLKIAVPAFKALEVKFERGVAARFGFQHPLPAEIKVADLQMLKLEREALKPPCDNRAWSLLHGVDASHVEHLVDVNSWEPDEAMRVFLSRYEELTTG